MKKGFVFSILCSVALLLPACSNVSNQKSVPQQTSHQSITTQQKSNSKSNVSKNVGITGSVSQPTIGVMVVLSESPNWFKQHIQTKQLYYGVAHHQFKNDLKGYHYIRDAHKTYCVFYQLTGNTVTYKISKYQANSLMTPKTVTLTQLAHNYYNNQKNKNLVDAYVSELRAD